MKDVLTFNEAAEYTGLSKSYLYKLTSTHQIPHYKPMGKCLFFNRLELEAFLQQNRVNTVDERTKRVTKAEAEEALSKQFNQKVEIV